MKILYNNQDGKIYYSVLDKNWFTFEHTTNIELNEFDIDETQDNPLCIELNKYGFYWIVDENGLNKYYINNGQVVARDNWVEYIEEFN